MVRFVNLFFDDAESLSKPSCFRHDFVLHELEAHGHDDHADEQIESTECSHATLVRFEILARHEVAKSDSCESDKTEICTYIFYVKKYRDFVKFIDKKKNRKLH